MREILFRGKRKDDGEWAYGGLDTDWGLEPKDRDRYWIIQAYLGEALVIPETIGQYTGLKDKNGKPIFEGDIVKYQFDNDDCPFPNKNTKKRIGRIFFSEFRVSFSIAEGRNGSEYLNDDLFKYVRNENRVEVIGNIHDNPELLEGSYE